MSLIVQKYGGTSVANVEKIKKLAQQVINRAKEGNKVVVVLSAAAGMTDELIMKAKEITPHPHGREYDMLVSVGEQMSIALFAMAVQSLGGEAISFNSAQVGIITDTAHTKAKIKSINAEKIHNELNKGKIVVIAGFQGVTEELDITTLGRGGSDTTGVALGVALNADAVEICKDDVDGLYTADPRFAKNTRKIDNISYEEMLELAGSGSKVLHLRAVELAAKYGIKLYLRSTFKDEKGTYIKEEDETMEKSTVRAIAHSKNEAKITIVGVPDKPGIAAHVFGDIAKDNINVDIIIQNLGNSGKNDISFTLPRGELKKAVETCERIRADLGAEKVVAEEEIGKVAIVGVGMKSNPGVAATMFKALADEGINIEMISTSEIKIACIINEKDVEKAIGKLHEVFIEQ